MSCKCGSSKNEERCATNGYQYAVKVVCGVLETNNVLTPLNPGAYRTIVNIHNPSNCETAQFAWKVASAGPEISSGVMTRFFEQEIRPDAAIEIGCAEAVSRILPLLSGPIDPNNALFEGWVVIESDVELDVVAVYSAGPRKGELSTMHTERVPARCISLCEDLDLILNTGTARWETRDASGNWVPAVLDARPSNIPGARWVVPAIPYRHPPGEGLGQSAEFRLCFDLCAGAAIERNVRLAFRADDRLLVRVNGRIPNNNNYHSTNWPWHTVEEDGNSATSNINIPSDWFVAGRNCIEVTLQDQWRVLWGFALAGRLQAVRGRCPCQDLPLLPCGSICYDVRSGFPFGGHDRGCDGSTAPPAPRPIRWLRLDLLNAVSGATVRMKTRTGSSWSAWMPESSWSVTSGIEDVRIELQNAPLHCAVQYRVLTGNGWTQWAQNGAPTNANSLIWGLEVRIV